MRQSLELRAGIEPAISPWHGEVLPLDQRSPWKRLGESPSLPVTVPFWCWRKDSNLHQTGFEPAPLPVGLHQHESRIEDRQWTPNFDPRFSIFNFGTGGGIRTLINWFLRPAPLPDWATPVKFEDRGLRMSTSIPNAQSSISVPKAEAAGVEPAQDFTRRLSTPLPYH